MVSLNGEHIIHAITWFVVYLHAYACVYVCVHVRVINLLLFM